ncbi:hypothetical protein FRC08_004505 [Ceratobasidium sp. 394]|nr:hypothetical protein FRC08_004505 [Ceratobasidium sp. 394]KAG9101974.1 hypothetical protein FS749_001023 [Ceratobasidium sp. UAMH 11750]
MVWKPRCLAKEVTKSCDFSKDNVDRAEDGIMGSGNNRSGDEPSGNGSVSSNMGSKTAAVKISPPKKKKAPSGLVISSRGAAATPKPSPNLVQLDQSHSQPTALSNSPIGRSDILDCCEGGSSASTAGPGYNPTTPPKAHSPFSLASHPRTSPSSMSNPPSASDAKSPTFPLSFVPTSASSAFYFSSSLASSSSSLRDECSVDHRIRNASGSSSPPL